MTGLLIGCARVSTDGQDLTTQRQVLAGLGVAPERAYVDHGLTDSDRDRPGLREALAARRAGHTLVVTTLDRLAHWVPDARDTTDELSAREVKLSLGGSVHDPTGPVGRLLVNVGEAVVAEFEVTWPRPGPGGDGGGAGEGSLRGKQPNSSRQEATSSSCTGPAGTRWGELGELVGVSRSRMYRAVQRAASGSSARRHRA